MTGYAQHYRSVDAFSGETIDLWVVDGVIRREPVRHAELVWAGGWILPGLVDAHNHVGIAPIGSANPVATMEQARGSAYQDARAGALLLREVGSPLDTHPLDGDPRCPKFLRAGKHIARPKRYLRGYGVELDDPDQLAAEVTRQAAAGDGWVKIVGDWIDRDAGDLAPLWTSSQLREAAEAAHAAGARITAHVFGADALPDIIEAGFDSIEHGTGLDEDLIDELVRRDIALVPTLIQLENFPSIADSASRFPKYQANMRALYAGRAEVFAAAREAGVRIYAGTDAGGFVEHGRIVDEVRALTTIGFSAGEALAAASTKPRDWLGAGLLRDGDAADFVIVDDDPTQDIEVLAAPSRIVCNGIRLV